MASSTFLNVDDTKAGMADLDKDRINRLIQEASKSRIVHWFLFFRMSKQNKISFRLDSKFFKQQQRREEVCFVFVHR